MQTEKQKSSSKDGQEVEGGKGVVAAHGAGQSVENHFFLLNLSIHPYTPALRSKRKSVFVQRYEGSATGSKALG